MAATDLSDLLLASGPDPEHEAELMLFGRLVGSWDVAARYFDPEGNVTGEARGEWHFGWGLRGRAVVDVLFSPPLADHREGDPWFEYGTTVRVYDPKQGVWRMTWNPTSQSTHKNLIARAEGDRIVMEGRAPEGHLVRWEFVEITDEFFLWQGRGSQDEGKTWVLKEEMRATRQR